jgi:hypothetical protein
MSAPAERNEPILFAALTLAIVTLRAAKRKARIANDDLLFDEADADLRTMEGKRTELLFQLEQQGGA